MALHQLRSALVTGALLSCAVSLPAYAAPEEAASMLAWGVAHAECAEWTDACQVCARAADGAPQCSTPGIACLPGPIACRKPAVPVGASPGK